MAVLEGDVRDDHDDSRPPFGEGPGRTLPVGDAQGLLDRENGFRQSPAARAVASEGKAIPEHLLPGVVVGALVLENPKRLSKALDEAPEVFLRIARSQVVRRKSGVDDDGHPPSPSSSDNESKTFSITPIISSS